MCDKMWQKFGILMFCIKRARFWDYLVARLQRVGEWLKRRAALFWATHLTNHNSSTIVLHLVHLHVWANDVCNVNNVGIPKWPQFNCCASAFETHCVYQHSTGLCVALCKDGNANLANWVVLNAFFSKPIRKSLFHCCLNSGWCVRQWISLGEAPQVIFFLLPPLNFAGHSSHYL